MTIDDLQNFLTNAPIADTLGLRLHDAAVDRTTITMPIAPHLTFDGTTVQGAIVATLADFAAVACASMVARPGQFVATIGCETHNLAPARGERLVAVGRLISKPGRRMVAAADVYADDESGPLCLTGLFTAAAIG
ncbi:PaaI family thioesterase [Gordonia sp. TBRC 11910]|uniref:PaaI family thioesterase n=1 Tax=Gordonia asplenii TaxID=2725283 RepID=A0A848KZB3_9ACTN|nr:PaaI family thioesterase [Gordonia asplenii]NMO01753.1 PaaI family thioesterase [Gordonia asplenii]